MSIFDSPSAQLHVDSELRYTYRPASLAIFDRVNIEIQNIGGRIEGERQSLSYDKDPLLQRFDQGTTIYPYVESLGPTTDLTELGKLLELPDNAEEGEKELESIIATLRADVAGQQIAFKSTFKGVLEEAVTYASAAGKFNARDYNVKLNELSTMHGHQTTLRDSLFAADLPSDPDAMWEAFVRAGHDYRKHLETQGAHDDTRCLYCWQVLNTNALELIGKYREYLEGQIAKDIDTLESLIQTLVKPVHDSSLIAVRAHCKPLDSDSDEDIPVPTEQAEQMEALLNLTGLDEMLRQRLAEQVPVDEHILLQISGIGPRVELWLSGVTAELETLRAQNADREKSLAKHENELQELKGRKELNRSWKEVQGIVAVASRQECLKSEREAISNVLRNLTNLSNKASEQLINHKFEEIFRNECEELRAPSLQLDFFGRQGVSQRKKTLQGNITPSRVLSEGEQKVIAIADFLAEARMSDNLVPVVFDDPVSSLDHRRIGEVARRIADLASNHQVVVFTHDIWLVTHLLDLFEKSDRCLYYQVTDDHGKGTVTAGTGPRWDTISRLRAKINSSIADAKKTAGEERDSHIRDAYDSIRSWCELFVEQEVLAKVTERYQPNVRMTSLSQINVPKLEITIESVLSVFEDACRYIEAHSQPLQTLGVAPKLSDLEEDWERLEKCRNRVQKRLRHSQRQVPPEPGTVRGTKPDGGLRETLQAFCLEYLT